MGHQGPGDGHPLLLAAGEPGDAALFKAVQGNQGEHLPDPGFDFVLGELLLPQGEGHVFKDVQVGEKGIFLKDRVDISLVGGHVVDALAQEDHVSLVGGFKAADEPEERSFAAAGGTQKGEKFVVVNVQVDIFQDGLLPVEGFGDVFQLNDFFHGRPPPKNKK